ncbi:hypothetical protein C8Q74DRAFT_307871 [Fomes fomentarius]|nr:hypothetical protein C8Q74DRAFT_307871 [Fomes fomentarius]
MRDIGCIPTELWTRIVTYACTDGGATGRSLALASKLLHERSRTARFHSLAFTSLPRIEAFLVFVRSKPKFGKPRIEHLYLSFHDDPIVADPDPEFEWLGSSIMSRDEKEHWDARYLAAMSSLLSDSLVHSTLRTLCIVEHPKALLPPFPCKPLSKLEEFTAYQCTDFFRPQAPARAAAEHDSLHTACPLDVQAVFPSLRRMHWSSDYSCPLPLIVPLLAETCPATLTHLRLSGVMVAAHDHVKLPNELAAAVSVGSPPVREECGDGDANSASLSIQPPLGEGEKLLNLQRLVLHGSCSGIGIPSTQWQKGIAGLLALRWKCESQSVVVTPFRRSWRHKPRWEERLREDWMDRIQGGEGCWIAKEDEL